MKTSFKIRIAADMAMILLLPILMAYSLVGEAAHEWIGITMFLLFILHHALNWRWYKQLTKGSYSPMRVLGTVVNTLLAIIMIALPVSGMMMARHTTDFLNLGMSGARIIHLLASHWGFVFMSLHLGLHWNAVTGMMKKALSIQKPSQVRTWFLRMLAVFLCGYGIFSFIELRYGEYLFLKNQFVFFDFSKPLFFSLAERVAVMCLFACISFYGAKLLHKNLKKSNKEVTDEI